MKLLLIIIVNSLLISEADNYAIADINESGFTEDSLKRF